MPEGRPALIHDLGLTLRSPIVASAGPLELPALLSAFEKNRSNGVGQTLLSAIVVIFIVAYAVIALEHPIKINKGDTETIVYEGGPEVGKDLTTRACRRAHQNSAEIISTVNKDPLLYVSSCNPGGHPANHHRGPESRGAPKGASDLGHQIRR